MPIPIYHVDAFTRDVFAGNPAAVCLLNDEKPATWMQAVAAEMNLSETAFVYAHNGGFNLRWFTPLAEANLCGHATLATAHILWECDKVDADSPIKFYTNSGVLTTRPTGGQIEMNFPAEKPAPCASVAGLCEAMGVTPVEVLKCQSDYLLRVDNETTVRNLQPDFSRLKEIAARGVMVTARAENDDVDFVSRFFAPRVGINEDPVTGSAHCVLAPYWADKLRKQDFIAQQLSKRGGELDLSLKKDRVLIRGKARTILKGELYAE